MEHLADNGFTVNAENITDLSAVKERYGVPVQLQGCHTAIVDGYVIEGHVPAGEIHRLLTERPDITGLAVPGMPIGSPGMEMGSTVEPFTVMTFDEFGPIEVFASYPK